MAKRVLITGGAGYIGSHLAAQIIKEEPHTVVVVIDDLSASDKSAVPQRALFFQASTADRRRLGELFSDYKFSTVFHFAAQPNEAEAAENPLLSHAINVSGTLNILEECRRIKTSRLIFASDVAVYGANADVVGEVAEDAPRKPSSFTGISKMAAELYCEKYAQAFGVQSVILRYAPVYGLRQSHDGKANGMNKLIDMIIRHESPSPNDYAAAQDMPLYIDDAVAAAMAAMKCNSEQSGAVTIAPSEALTLSERMKLVYEAAGFFDARPDDESLTPPRSPARYNCDKAHSLLLWQPAVSFADGIKRCIDRYSQDGKK